MALRLAILISTALLLFGCVRSETASESRAGCASCHVAHYVEIGACAECHRGQPSAARKELAHARLLSGRVAEHGLTQGKAVSEGGRMVDAAACRRCHTIGGQGNALATNLDRVVWEREQSGLMTSITQPVENMPTFGSDDDQAEAMIAYLLSSARRGATEEAYRVQFVRDSARAPSTFDDKCGGCHRLLTSLGPRGLGRQGPNLSGLLTAFYPRTAPGDLRWSEKSLTDWLANPRAMRPLALMPPVGVSRQELQEILEQIRVTGS